MAAVPLIRTVITADARAAVRNMNAFSRSAAGVQNSLRGLNVFLSGVVIQRATAALARQADEYVNINNQIKLVAKNWGDVAVSQDLAFQIAQRTRTSYESVGTLVTRIGRSAERMGATQQQVLAATESIQQSFRISGSTVRESAAAAIQFAQALGKGRLDGDELRSVLENNLRLSQVIADEFNVSVDALKEMGAEGELVSGRVLGAILNASKELNAEFQELDKTFEDSKVILDNAFTRFIGQASQALNLSDNLFESSLRFAETLEEVTPEIVGFLVTAQAGFTNLLVDAQLGAKQVELGFVQAKQGLEALIGIAPDLGAAIEDLSLPSLVRDALSIDDDLGNDISNAITGFFKDLNVDTSVFDDLFGFLNSDEAADPLKAAELSVAERTRNISGFLRGLSEEGGDLMDNLANLVEDTARTTEEITDAIDEVTPEVANLNAEIAALRNQREVDIVIKGEEAAAALRAELVRLREERERLESQPLNTELATQGVIQLGETGQDVFGGLETALESMFTAVGDGSQNAARIFATSFLQALQRILASQLALQFLQLVGFNQSGTEFNAGGLLGNIIGGLVTGGFSGGGQPGDIGPGGAVIQGPPQRFRDGGSGVIPGSGGHDSKLFLARVTPGESFRFTPKGKSSDGGVTIQNQLVVQGSVNEDNLRAVQGMIAQSERRSIARIADLMKRGRFG